MQLSSTDEKWNVDTIWPGSSPNHPLAIAVVVVVVIVVVVVVVVSRFSHPRHITRASTSPSQLGEKFVSDSSVIARLEEWKFIAGITTFTLREITRQLGILVVRPFANSRLRPPFYTALLVRRLLADDPFDFLPRFDCLIGGLIANIVIRKL